MAPKPGLAARRAAARLLSGVTSERRMLSEMTGAEGVLGPLAPPDRARALSLATGVLRHLSRLDPLLEARLDRRPPGAVLQVLRVMAFELLVERAAAYAAVDLGVAQVRHGKLSRFSGLVNAVGRRLAEADPATLAEPALPGWMEKPIIRAWGEAAAAAMAQAHLAPAPLDLTPRDPAEAEALAAEMGAECLPTGSLRLATGGQVTALPGFAEGRWWVQDAAAALPVQLLGDLRGLEVIDLCAAPGGKTMQLAAAGATVTAVDLSGARLARVEENLARTRLPAAIVEADALTWAPERVPDIVVLDAPCSATGTLRRHPDLPHVRPAPDLGPLLDLQEALIDRALGWLGPGGRLLYCTCSLLPREGETQITRARGRHPELIEGAPRPAGVEPDWMPEGAALRLRPDYWAERGGMDGFFATVLTKPA